MCSLTLRLLSVWVRQSLATLLLLLLPLATLLLLSSLVRTMWVLPLADQEELQEKRTLLRFRLRPPGHAHSTLREEAPHSATSSSEVAAGAGQSASSPSVSADSFVR